MLSKVLKCLAAPFVAGKNFVDQRPSINDVRRHLNQMQAVVVENTESRCYDVKLQFLDAPTVESRQLLQVDTTGATLQEEEHAKVYASGIVKGFELTTGIVQNIRRSTISTQDKLIRAAVQEKCLAEADQARAKEEASVTSVSPVLA